MVVCDFDDGGWRDRRGSVVVWLRGSIWHRGCSGGAVGFVSGGFDWGVVVVCEDEGVSVRRGNCRRLEVQLVAEGSDGVSLRNLALAGLLEFGATYSMDDFGHIAVAEFGV
ncbi:unnamed protein product [Vicia faba]|uniref:Uncharacterized protein n=1 Tax=Vicia faba TaxID=3906 RepID=A0AAV1AV56_VICFA|nr:unnamed protein product [Vicia faba]